MTPLAPKKNTMKKNAPIRRKLVPAKGQAPDIQRRINAGWLKLWRVVYPNTPPPKKVQSPESRVQSLKASVQGSRFKVRPPSAVLVRRTGGLRFGAHSSDEPRPAAVELLASFLSIWLALALLATGLCRPPASQRRQGRHDAKAGRYHRADHRPKREPEPDQQTDPRERESAHLHSASRLPNRAIPAARCRST
jgi:hypothetical protein